MVTHIFYFHPENWGRFPCWLIFFQMGWFNHQPEKRLPAKLHCLQLRCWGWFWLRVPTAWLHPFVRLRGWRHPQVPSAFAALWVPWVLRHLEEDTGTLGLQPEGFAIYIRFKKWRYYWFSSQLVDLTQRMYMYEYMLYLDLPFLCQIWCQKSQKKRHQKVVIHLDLKV